MAKKLLFGSITVFLSVLVALFAAEWAVRLAAPNRTLGSLVEKEPELGYRFLRNASTTYYQEGRYLTMRTNNVGLRQDDDVAPEKAPGERRVLVVGDSYA